MRILPCVLGVLFFVASAQAEDEPPQAIHTLTAAAGQAAAFGDVRYAFSLDHWSEQNGEELNLRLRFDPRMAQGEQWSLLDASLDDLSKVQRKAFKQFQKSENPDDALVYDKLEDMLGDVVLVEETTADAIFTAPVVSEDLPEGVLEMTIMLNKAAGFVSQIDMRSIKPFKPAAIAKIKSMTQSQTFAAPDSDGVALLQTSEGAANGKAVLKSFTSQSRQSYFDIERIDPPASPVADTE